jgi:nucleoside-diphosphate-sugar epimerase
MTEREREEFSIEKDDLVLVTGATGFIGKRLVKTLLDRGFRNLRCFARPSSDVEALFGVTDKDARIEVFTGNLLSREDCLAATKGAKVIFHLAAGTSEKSFAGAYLNSVVTTRNLLEAAQTHDCLRKIVTISSFVVYSNNGKRGRLLDESCEIEAHPDKMGDAYCYAKVRQDQFVAAYCDHAGIPYVIVRPGYVYGPGKTAITGRVGIDTFGFFLHLGGSNLIPFTYVDNCAEAIMLAGLRKESDGQVFNVVDDALPSSRQFLRQYKRQVKRFRSVYLPHALSYLLCYAWERYSAWSEGQLPPAFNRIKWRVFWKKTRYSNEKLKGLLGWTPKVSIADGLSRYFEACRSGGSNA